MYSNSLNKNGIVNRYFHFEEKYVRLSANISILCEINMNLDDYEKVMYTTKQYLLTNPTYEKEICERIWLYAPMTMLLTTITFAINHYDGAFWNKFGEAIALNNHDLWRESFYKALEKQNMYVFKGSKNQRYVYNILGHSGIPRSQVGAFVKSVILPAIQYDYTADQIQQIIRSGNKDTPIKTYQLIESVKDFIKIPDSIATNILERSMEVWRERLQPFTEHYEGYLPLNLLEEFEQIDFANEQRGKAFPQPSFAQPKLQIHMRKPTMHYSPEYQNVYISLPKQTLPSQVQEVTWKIQSEHFYKEVQTLRIPYENDEVEFKVMKKKSQLPILPRTSYNVQLLIDKVVTGDWFFEVSDFTIFNAVTYEQILGTNIIAKQLLIITTKSHERFLQSENISYQSISLLEDWSGFIETDVTVKKGFTYSTQQQRFVFSPSRTHVTLVGNKHDLISNLPIYKGSLRFRVNNKQFGLLSALPNWQLKIIHNYSGKHVKHRLQAHDFIQNTKGHYDMTFPNTFQQLLDNQPGHYTLKMYGFLGKDTEIQFYYMRDVLTFVLENEALIVETSSGYQVNPLNANTTVLSDSQKKIAPIPAYEKLNFDLEMPNSFEKIAISYYPNNISLKLMQHTEVLPLGTITTKGLFSFEQSKVIIDLENPLLQTNSQLVTVAIFEKLNDGSFYEKKHQLRVGRKHIMTLNYFAHQPNSLTKRHLFLRIPDLSINLRLVTIETEWHVTRWQQCDQQVAITISTQLPALTANVYHLLTGNCVHEISTQEPSNQILLPVDSIEAGYYVISLNETTDDDFDDLFGFTSMPEKIGPHDIVMPLSTDDCFDQWLLANEHKTDDGEWQLEELKVLFDLILSNKKLYIPLLLDNYETCTDFGLMNIEQLPELLQLYKGEDLQQLLLICGIQEWDPISVEKAIEADFVLPTDESLYVPSRFKDYVAYLPAQLNHSYNNTVQQEQCLKGFSLTHEILQLLGRMYLDSEYNAKCVDFSNKYSSLLAAWQTIYSDKPQIGYFNAELSLRKEEQNFFYTIGTFAYFNSLLFYYEYALQPEHLDLIREATPIAYELAPKLFLHDVVYWKYQLDRYEDALKSEVERRKQFEHPSFTWKK